jgi:hypothetical protein
VVVVVVVHRPENRAESMFLPRSTVIDNTRRRARAETAVAARPRQRSLDP